MHTMSREGLYLPRRTYRPSRQIVKTRRTSLLCLQVFPCRYYYLGPETPQSLTFYHISLLLNDLRVRLW